MKTIAAAVVVSLALALLPTPKICLQNPKLLYAVAMYKTAVGDTDSALRLLQRADQRRQARDVARPANPNSASIQSSS